MATATTTLTRQLEELYLLKCSLLPGELLTFVLDAEQWMNMIEIFPDTSSFPHTPFQARFEVKIESSNIWFEVKLPHNYPNGDPPIIAVKGEDVTRNEQERWIITVRNKLEELKDCQYLIYELFSLHLLPLLHTNLDNITTPKSPANRPSTPSKQYHALLTSHHLISPHKRRSLHRWSSSLSISGFAKIGYPGVIYAYGDQRNVEEFVCNVKGMQWLALRIRFIEPIQNDSDGGGWVGEKTWLEVQKVGEVVDEMKRIRREECILEMGIGSGASRIEAELDRK